MVNNCGLSTWTFNSQVTHGTFFKNKFRILRIIFLFLQYFLTTAVALCCDRCCDAAAGTYWYIWYRTNNTDVAVLMNGSYIKNS